jgi:hypothetical protein
MLRVSLIFLAFERPAVRTVTRERCFIDTPHSVAFAVRAMLPSYPCECTERYRSPQKDVCVTVCEGGKERSGCRDRQGGAECIIRGCRSQKCAKNPWDGKEMLSTSASPGSAGGPTRPRVERLRGASYQFAFALSLRDPCAPASKPRPAQPPRRLSTLARAFALLDFHLWYLDRFAR